MDAKWLLHRVAALLHAPAWVRRAEAWLVRVALVLGAMAPATIVGPLGAAASDARVLASTSVAAGPFPKILRDPLGDARVLARPPTRIVSAVLAADEMLLELVGPTRLAGVTSLVDEPATTLSARLAPPGVARVSGQVEPILALKPDLVIVAGYTPAETTVQLLAAGAPVLRVDRYESFADVERNIEELGRATGEEAQAQAVVASLRARVEAVRNAPRPTPPPRVLFWSDGATAGRRTLLDECIRHAGGINVAAEAGLEGPVSIGIEFALASDPDVVVVPIPTERPQPRAPELLSPAEHWRALSAYRRGNVHGLPSAWTGAVSQHAVHALEALGALLRGRLP